MRFLAVEQSHHGLLARFGEYFYSLFQGLLLAIALHIVNNDAVVVGNSVGQHSQNLRTRVVFRAEWAIDKHKVVGALCGDTLQVGVSQRLFAFVGHLLGGVETHVDGVGLVNRMAEEIGPHRVALDGHCRLAEIGGILMD